jgi:hypothetical protein
MPNSVEFVKLTNQRFEPPLRGNAFDELIQLKRESTLADYQSRFLVLVNRYIGLNEKQQINIFTTDLHNPLKTDVELEHPDFTTRSRLMWSLSIRTCWKMPWP